MNDLYFGLPPPTSKENNTEIVTQSRSEFEETYTRKNSGSSTWSVLINSLTKQNNINEGINEPIAHNSDTETKPTDVEYNPITPNVYTVHQKVVEPLATDQTLQIRDAEVKFEIGRKLLKKMGWIEGQGLG
ncbi:G-patch domain-containing protein [Cryptosporidium canis]|uniref:G-patch domain-containing protein n=1 Tax=Cryptosporidium canis TaxID=195482 RepID=A0ABQ8P774_9CRYT|nr:G-patch domain-containing protein [Cryptosporidium canis]KAJ1611715.1 G-patch domain-containing protein [Cryptosporidium canis]